MKAEGGELKEEGLSSGEGLGSGGDIGSARAFLRPINAALGRQQPRGRRPAIVCLSGDVGKAVAALAGARRSRRLCSEESWPRAAYCVLGARREPWSKGRCRGAGGDGGLVRSAVGVRVTERSRRRREERVRARRGGAGRCLAVLAGGGGSSWRVRRRGLRCWPARWSRRWGSRTDLQGRERQA
ncbi:uncharacterized protein A4U43_C05F22350 [Asparagus officinalis]|uniref:Uncharacterized protein n=1 Tax=Asparagus officinalis TaxID=4686 RepID=A0A5P1EXX2_ASPOF|nr:uncharacterized protein A4U43_C05F22350 [Asparagus officinalis]